jgi:hypothetical protein
LVSLGTQYVEGFTDQTPNVYYSIGDDGAFLTWLNYVTSHSSIPLAGYWQTDEQGYGDYPKTIQRAYFFKLGRDHGVGEETTITHDSFGWLHFIPIFPITCTFLLSHTAQTVAYSATNRGWRRRRAGNSDFVLNGLYGICASFYPPFLLRLSSSAG